MINLPFHLSINIEEFLQEAERLKTSILTTPLAPKEENQYRWEITLEKTYWGLTLADNPLSKKEMAKLLSTPQLKKMTDHQREVVEYANTINYIRNEWTATKKPITTRDVLHIYDLACREVFGSTTSYFKSKETEVGEILKYIESGKDHPIIKAGLIQIEIVKLSPFENGTGRTARLLSHLILAKYGYDLRGLLCLEDYYRSDLVSLKNASISVELYKSATIWLEYFSQGVVESLRKTNEKVRTMKNIQTLPSSFWKLNQRLQKIIDIMENPNIKMTNKEVQKRFGVSQITASRDLAKLASLGIILSHGKGRSVFYSKI